MTPLRACLPFLVGAAVLVPAALPAHAAPAAVPGAQHVSAKAAGPRSAVTWQGWRGVEFASPLTAAHRKLGGTLTRTDPSGGCGDVLDTRTGTLDGNVYRHPHDVGTIRVDAGIDYPLGVDQTMTPRRVLRQVEQSRFTVHTHRFHPHGTGDVQSDNVVVGPQGHTLFFSYVEGSGKVDRMGVSVDRHVASQQMDINGC